LQHYALLETDCYPGVARKISPAAQFHKHSHSEPDSDQSDSGSDYFKCHISPKAGVEL
jgi:hypothetical protein